jgi:hypothetical protein
MPTDVVGRFHNTCHRASGDVDVPLDLSRPQIVIRAWVPDGSAGGYRLVTGTGSADGSFVLHDVPVGATYLLHVPVTTPDTATYWVTDQHVIDLHGDYVIRCSPLATTSSAPINVTLDITNMTSFMPGDRLEIGSISLGNRFTVPFSGTGSTVLHASVTWLQGSPLVDAAAGDDLVLNHIRLFPVTGSAPNSATEFRILDQFEATGTTMQSGIPVALSGAFHQLTPNHSGTLSIDQVGLQAGYERASTLTVLQLYLIAEPPERVGGGLLTDAVVWRLDVFGNPPLTGTTMIPYSYADPFPDSWTRTLTTFDDRVRLVKLTSAPSGVNGIGWQNELHAAYTGSIVATHTLPPPTGLTVAGVDFERGGAVPFDGQSPVVVRWNPVPGAQLYRVDLGRAGANPGTVAMTTITTADTSLTVPAALIETGTLYQLIINAIQAPIDYRGGHLLVGPPTALVGVPSARFRFLPHCGDGIVQAGEDCDTHGESATCNADCTSAMCGDGVVNAAAGEACDTVESSDTCTADCKLP